MKICSVENCDKKSKCHGLCIRHYNQMRVHGEITSTSKRTQLDPNEFIIDGAICWVILYDTNCIEKARAKYYDQISDTRLKWHLITPGYAQAVWSDETGQHKILLHEAIFQLSGQEVPPGYEIDHKDGDKLNALDDNLRICTHTQNGQNRGKQKNNTSGQKGVSWSKRVQKWRSRIMVDSKEIHLGYFDTIEDAARAYNDTAIKYFGEFAQLNDI